MLAAACAVTQSERAGTGLLCMVTDYFTEQETFTLKEKFYLNNGNHTNQIYYEVK